MTNPITNWFFKGQNTRIPNESTASWKDLFVDDWKQRGKFGKGGSKGGWDLTRGFRPGVPANEGGFMSGPTPLGRQAVLRGLPFLTKYVSTPLMGAQIFKQGQEGSLLDRATAAMPNLQVGQLGINNNPETDIGKRVWDFLTNRASEIGTYNGGAEIVPLPYYPDTDNTSIVPLPYYPDKDNTSLVPLDSPFNLAAGKSPFSTPYWDKQNQLDKYFENIRRLKERGLLGGIPKA